MGSLAMGSWVTTSCLVSKMPLTKVAEPERPDSFATHVLWTSSAVRGPGPTPPGPAQLALPAGSPEQRRGTGVSNSSTPAELVAEPPVPVLPWVLTLRGPELDGTAALAGHWPLKMAAGP